MKNLGPRNIQDKWIQSLDKKAPHNIGKSKELTKISFKLNDVNRKVLINEAENWFVLISSAKVEYFTKDRIEDLVMALSNKAVIGFYDFVEISGNNDFKLIFKSHQRFIRNDDDYNIIRTIQLHIDDHQRYFADPLKTLASNQALSECNDEFIVKSFTE